MGGRWGKVLMAGVIMVVLGAGTAVARGQIEGTMGDDVLRGTMGHDSIDSRGGADFVRGLDGTDTIWGASGDDVLRGNKKPDRIMGEGGRDRIYGGWGDDVLHGAYGCCGPYPNSPASPDLIRGEGGDDFIDSADRVGAPDRVFCGDGNDEVYADREDVVGRGCEVVRRAN